MNPTRAAIRGRIAARNMMRDTVDILRPTGGWTTDSTGNTVPVTTTIATGVPAWIKVLSQQSRVVESAGQPVTLLAYDVLLPWNTPGIADEDLISVTSSAGTDLQGRVLTVADVTHGTYQVFRRLVCMLETSAPGVTDAS